jgi:putative transposase
VQRKALVGHLIDRYRVSIQRACKVRLQSRAGWYQKPKGKPFDEPLKARMREIASTRVRFGFWRIYVLMRREGWKVTHMNKIPASSPMSSDQFKSRHCSEAP